METGSDKIIAYERTLGDERLVVQCNFSGDELDALSCEGGKLLIGNYAETAADGGATLTLRPWEAVAYIWR